MYTRINPQTGVREFSSCKVIKLQDGRWVSNPTAEQIAAEGWKLYVPPVIPPQPQTEPSGYDKIAALNKILASEIVALDDEAALEVMALFPTWISHLGILVHAGERYYFNEALYKVILDHIPQADWTPDKTPNMWRVVSLDEWPEWIQPLGDADAYTKGDKVSHNGKHWISDVDGNVWEPGVYGWAKV